MVTMENYEEYMLLEADGELTEAEQKELYTFVDRHPGLKNELALFKAAKIEPDTSMVFEGKDQLLKTAAIKTRTINVKGWWMYGAAVAACLAVVLLLARKPKDNPTENSITRNTATNNTPATNNQIPATLEPATHEDLHSTPKGPVAIKTEKKKVPAHNTIAQSYRPVKAVHTTTQPNSIEQVAHYDPSPHDVPTTQLPQEVKNEPAPVAHKELVQPPATQEPVQQLDEQGEKENKKLLAITTVENKFDGITEIKDAVNEKIKKVKNITSKIKETDIRFYFGNSEFTVKL